MQAARSLDLDQRLYDIADPRKAHRYGQLRGKGYSPDDVINQAGATPRDWARHQDENNDLAISILDTLVDQFYVLEPTPNVTLPNGSPDETRNAQIAELWEEMTSSGTLAADHTPWSEYKRQIGRAWLRDGDVFVMPLRGRVEGVEHKTEVPYTLHAFEADYCPLWLSEPPNLVAGVRVNRFNRPSSYFMYTRHPGPGIASSLRGARATVDELVEVSAGNVWQLKFARRLGQVRGITVLHGVQGRLADLHDYEESERIAAKIAASFSVILTRPATFGFNPSATPSGSRSLDLEPGMIMDFAGPGEDVKTVDTNRPSSEVTPFRAAMMRAATAGTGASYSTVTRSYEGSYSSQRQEMQEAKPGYDRLRNYWIAAFLERCYRDVIAMGVLMGRIDGRGLTMAELTKATYDGAITPWIDPDKGNEGERDRGRERVQVAPVRDPRDGRQADPGRRGARRRYVRKGNARPDGGTRRRPGSTG